MWYFHNRCLSRLIKWYEHNKGVECMQINDFEKMKNGKGFIAALDQSGGSTPKALAAYGVSENAYTSEDEMFDLVHEMRTRIITSPAFDSDSILGAILFEQTMESKDRKSVVREKM